MKKERDPWESERKCPECKVWMKKGIVIINGMDVREWTCPKCEVEVLHPLDAQKTLLIAKLRKHAARVKVGNLREAPYVRFPKEMGILVHKGDVAVITTPGKDRIEIQIEHKESES